MQINAYNNWMASVAADVKNSARIDNNAAPKASEKAVELGRQFGAILEKALVQPDGHDAVAQAKQALADGSLETQQAFDDAAEGLLNGM